MIFDKIDIVTRREDSEDSQALVIFRLQEIVACVHGETSRGNLSCFETMRMECIWFNWCSDGIKFNIVFSESNWPNWCITRYCSKCKCFLVISISSKLSLQTKLANNPLADCFFFFFIFETVQFELSDMLRPILHRNLLEGIIFPPNTSDENSHRNLT